MTLALQGIAIGAAGLAQAGLIEHIQRCAVALGQLTDHASTNPQPPLGIEIRTHGGQIAIGALHIHAVGSPGQGRRCDGGSTHHDERSSDLDV